MDVLASGVVSITGGRRVALFFTGRPHAGESLANVLKPRSTALPPTVQMCDALSRNTPKLAEGVEILFTGCLAHGRRQFVKIAASFPAECRHVLEMLYDVYRNGTAAREQGCRLRSGCVFIRTTATHYGQAARLDGGGGSGEKDGAELGVGIGHPNICCAATRQPESP
jgi:hypothetical protein